MSLDTVYYSKSGCFANAPIVEIDWVRECRGCGCFTSLSLHHAASPVCFDLRLSPQQSEQSPKDMGHPCAPIKDSARDNTAAFHTQRSKNEVRPPQIPPEPLTKHRPLASIAFLCLY